MQGFVENVLGKAKQNTDFRQVLENGKHTQIVIMNIPPGTDIGEETHAYNDQVLFLIQGQGKVILNGEEKNL